MKTYPLLQSQLGVFLECVRFPETTQYNLPIAISFGKAINVERLVAAIQRIFQARPMLHTRFVMDESGEVRQWSDPEMVLDILRRQCAEAELVGYIDNGFTRPFALLTGEPLMRCEIVETEERVCCLLDFHHTIMDGASICRQFFPVDLPLAYAGKPLAEPEYTLYEAAEVEQGSFASEQYSHSKQYCKEHFANCSFTSLSSTEQWTFGRLIEGRSVMPRVACDGWCAEQGIRPYSLFQAALAVVMSRVSREETVIFASAYHGRGEECLRSIYGMFIQQMPISLTLRGDEKCLDFLRRQREELDRGKEHRCYPFSHFCQELNMTPGVAYNFLGASNFEEKIVLDGVEGRLWRTEKRDYAGEMILYVEAIGDDYVITTQAGLGMYSAERLQVLAEAIVATAQNMMAHPEALLKELAIVSPAQAKELIALGTGERVDYDTTETFLDCFRKQVEIAPKAIALQDESGTLTYAELDARADAVASVLVARGVKPNDFIAVKMPRVKEFLVAVLGIWKAGGAYIPVDPAYPEERIAYMVEDSQARVVVDQEFLDKVDFSRKAEALPVVSPENLAYMIYTSGSTGKPKGVMVPHKALRSFSAWLVQAEEIKAGDAVACHASFSFDASVCDLYPPLTAGATLHIYGDALRMDLNGIVEYIQANHIVGGTFTTQLGMDLLNSYSVPLRYIMLGGEKLKPCRKCSVRIFNGYGPTEFTVCSTYYVVDQQKEEDDIPIGRPVPNSISAIVDGFGHLLPRGIAGELVHIGTQISRGYWNRPELTSQRYVEPSFLPGEKMYRTGDLACWNNDGNLLYIGRIDTQVKLRGFRIELGEIESTLEKCAGIVNGIAEVKSIHGIPHLVGYYTSEGAVDEAQVLAEMGQTLTEYMVPEFLVHLDALPLTPNGKVNRKALPLPELRDKELVAPSTELEKELFGIVASELGTEEFGVTTNLISMGLSSMRAMHLSAVIKQKTGLSISTADILGAPRIRDWQVEEKKGECIAVQSKRPYYPLTANQLGVYLDWEKNRQGLQYNIPAVFRFAQVEAEKLRQSLERVLEVHPYFQCHIEQQEGGPVLLPPNDVPLKIEVTILDEVPTTAFFQALVKPFDLCGDDLARFAIFDAPDGVYLFCDVHHIVCDGASESILLASLLDAYEGKQLPVEQLGALDYALYMADWQKSPQYATAENYFQTLLGTTESFAYPGKDKVDAVGNAGSLRISFPRNSIRECCRKLEITENAFLATAICQVCHRVARVSEVQIATVSSGRSLSQLVNSFGMFVQTLPLVSLHSKGNALQELLAMQKQVTETLRHERFPYTALVEKYGVRPEVMYVYQGDVLQTEGNALHPEYIALELDTVKMPLALNVLPNGDAYELLLEYDTARYSASQMECLASGVANFAQALSQADEATDLTALSLVSAEESSALLSLGRGPQLNYDLNETVVDLFRKQVSERPQSVAVVDSRSSITYGELDRWSDILANALVSRDVRPGHFVGIKLPRIKEFMVSVLGIWKAGAAYVPIDPEYPADRIAYMVEDSEAKAVIDEAFLASLDFSAQVSVQPICKATRDCLAYMIYTSGSTGKPKGVMVGHDNLRSYVGWMCHDLDLKPGEGIVEHLSLSFDGSLSDLYPSIASGATLHILDEGLRKDLAGIDKYLKDNKIIGATFPTQFGMAFLNTYDVSLRYVTLGGEKLLATKPGKTQVLNGYGPTEFTVCSSYHRVNPERDGENIPIGYPVANSISAIVDGAGQLLPRGMAGELALLGRQLTRGYWHRLETTAEHFVASPFLAGQKMYRTGDLTQWDENGELLYLGRIDQQVKLRGFRIELGEVETAIGQYPGVKAAAADVKTILGIQHLIGYYVADGTIDEVALKAQISQGLTEYMVPDAFVKLDVLPLTPNGKLNRKALPLPDESAFRSKYEAPKTATERLLCQIFGEILGMADFSVTDDFFLCGGTSLIAIRVIVELQKQGLEVVYGDLFAHKTPRALAAFLDGDASKATGEKSFRYGDYDYTAIDGVLQGTPSELTADFAVQPLGDVLLTGSTGFLGIHLLKALLENTEGKIGVLVRGKRGLSLEKRLKLQYIYYFEELFTEEQAQRIVYIEGDISQDDLADRLSGFHFDTLLNSAAMVKHYVSDDKMDKVNVHGVQNLIACCQRYGARLIHVSTYSIGGIIPVNSAVKLDERHFYIGQDSDNEYIRTKFLAERYILEAVAQKQLRGKIMRLGNLMGRASDGEFQMNLKDNAFVNSLRTYQAVGAYPLMELTTPLEMTPIDQCAQAIVKLATTPDDMVIFQPFNTYQLDMHAVLEAINAIHHSIRYVPTTEFHAAVEELRNDPARAELLQGILHYGRRNLQEWKVTEAVNAWTTTVLYRLGFSWRMPSEEYLHQFMDMLSQMRIFQKK